MIKINNNIDNNNLNNNISLSFLPSEPLLVCAPMVDQSELPFRMLCRKYGSNLCYTPMLHSKIMTTQKGYK
jgi:tRNA-dihydrouridine synthase